MKEEEVPLDIARLKPDVTSSKGKSTEYLQRANHKELRDMQLDLEQLIVNASQI